MTENMIAVRRLGFCVLLLAAGIWIVFSPQSSRAQQETVAKRRLVDRVAPAYPPLARSMALEGIVKVEALVAPDGSVKTVDIKGGHPVLAQAALNAVRHWKWEPAAHESHEVVELKFFPPAE
jgi:TonB family protein